MNSSTTRLNDSVCPDVDVARTRSRRHDIACAHTAVEQQSMIDKGGYHRCAHVQQERRKTYRKNRDNDFPLEKKRRPLEADETAFGAEVRNRNDERDERAMTVAAAEPRIPQPNLKMNSGLRARLTPTAAKA